jgi:hypothetical protein
MTDRTPSTGTPTPPPSDAALRQWRDRYQPTARVDDDPPADVAGFVGGL